MSRQHKRSKSKETWEKWWDARIEAMQAVLGEMDATVHHAAVPFEIGADLGGTADIVSFSKRLDGIAYATSELIGNNAQRQNRLGNYELMICHREPSDWGPEIISRLAYYTLDNVLNPGETMDIGPAVPKDSRIAAFLFQEFATFKVFKHNAGLLLCLGITQDELEFSFEQGTSALAEKLKKHGVYPYTDLMRSSVLS